MSTRMEEGSRLRVQRATVNRLSRLALGADEAEILDEAVRSVAEALHVEMAKYFEVTPNQDALLLRAAVGYPASMVGVLTVPAGGCRSYAGFVLSAGHPVSVTDLRTEARFDAPPFLRELGVVSALSVVVHGNAGEALGVLSGAARSEREFTEDEAEFLQTVANLVSAGVIGRRSEQRFRELVQNSSDLIAIVDDKGELVYSNPAGERILGFCPAEMVGLPVLSLVHPQDREKATEAFVRDISQPGVHPAAAYRFRTASGGWRFLEVVATNCLDHPAVGGIVLNARDITERTNLTRVLRTLSAGSRALVNASDEASLLSGACHAIVGTGGFALAWVGYAIHDEGRTVRPMAWAGPSGYPGRIRVSWADDAFGNGPSGTAIRTRQVQVSNDLSAGGQFAPWRATAEECDLRSSCSLPLEVNGEVVGALSIYASEPGAFGPPEVALLSELADDLSYGLGRLRDAVSLQASEQRFRALADGAPIGILETSPIAMVDYANPRMAEITGRDVASLMGRGWVGSVHPDHVAELIAVAERVHRERVRVTTTFRIQRPDGEIRHVRMLAAAKNDDPDSGDILTIEDISDEVAAQEALAHQAFHDALTGLPNRALFLERLNGELAGQQRGGPKIVVLFLDLDQFKVVNESLGHRAGDDVLKEVSDRFARGMRAGETAARFSGDKFIFIIHGVGETMLGVTAAKRLLALLEPPIRMAGHDLNLTASIGIVVVGDQADATAVLRDADTAMYQAKAGGRNRYAIFDEDLRHRTVKRLSLEGELRQALARDEFDVYYQPSVEPYSGRPLSAEALARWQHPTRGLVSPLEFIPVAEDSGLIKPIGRWVFEQSMRQLALWDAQSDGPRLESLAVNISARQLDDPETLDMVRDVLQRFGIDPSRACVEVTESVMMNDISSARRSLASLRELGLGVAIDDFGTGYSSLSYLHTLPVTSVKIDRSFVVRLGSPDDSTPVVRAIIEMCRATGLDVVAEGVEDARLQALVSDLGCETAQGFYWARPMPAADFANWWRTAGRTVRT